MSEALKYLLASDAHGFVLLHGLGGIGKTTLARAVAERVNWYYKDRLLALSFETFAKVDSEDRIIVNETFADGFYNRLARYYGLDPSPVSNACRVTTRHSATTRAHSLTAHPR